jgi:hypothetical protein
VSITSQSVLPLQSLPRDDAHSQESAETAEHQSNDSSGGEAAWEWCRALVLALEIHEVDGITCRVALCGCSTVAAGLVVIVGDLQRTLQLKRSFNKSDSEAGCEMPVKVAV